MSWAKAPYEPTPPEIVRRMLRIAMVRPGDIVYDLGCGDARILITAVKEFGARALLYSKFVPVCFSNL